MGVSVNMKTRKQVNNEIEYQIRKHEQENVQRKSIKLNSFNIETTVILDESFSYYDFKDLQKETHTSYDRYLLDDLYVYGIDDEDNCHLLSFSPTL